ncbi:hypothetical protein CERSUDRAFT_93160 [Gelatoporia subvermispora B]|uniref:Uncharacterized protein n=1 Tax=Ceriporiopsis subvermispora (strain B) TaxID=914234 RepID=M2PRA3_CERS8|nr:hypothetical protein CERSUDRAFT_93160 [Gelatoporia subvermispora B]
MPKTSWESANEPEEMELPPKDSADAERVCLASRDQSLFRVDAIATRSSVVQTRDPKARKYPIMSQLFKRHSPSAIALEIAEWLKPSRGEALARLRTNSLGLLMLTILTSLLPLPSPWTAIDVVRERKPAGIMYYYLCVLESLALAVLLFNVAQSSYALKYPRPAPVSASAPSPAPTKSAPVSPSPPPRQWRLKGLTPNSSPQRQKAFSYAASPVSTPSRTLNYSIPSTASPLDASFSSFSSSIPPSPSSPLAAYRGRHGASTGRAFDGSLLSRLRPDSDED